MGYYCMKCKRHVEIDNKEFQGVRCPYCGYRAMRKERSKEIVKEVKAV